MEAVPNRLLVRRSPSTAPVMGKMVTSPRSSGGWDYVVMGMQVGETAHLRCSPDYAYGKSGFPAWGIQPNSVLDFETEVLKVE